MHKKKEGFFCFLRNILRYWITDGVILVKMLEECINIHGTQIYDFI